MPHDFPTLASRQACAINKQQKSQAPTSQIKKTKSCQPTAHLDPKRRIVCTLDGEQLMKSCPKSSALLNPLIGHLQTLNTMRSGTSTTMASLSNGLISTQLQYRNFLQAT
jgi:hypothetical protein